MPEPSRPRPVPGPPTGTAPRPAPPAAAPVPDDTVAAGGPAAGSSAADRYGDLDQRPVGEHVDVFEAEHARLERELRTIDQL